LSSTFENFQKIKYAAIDMSYKEGGKLRDITNKDMSKALKLAAAELNYPAKNIYIA